jgi:serine/threonine protein kinase
MTEHANPSVWNLLPASDAADQARADQDARWRAGKPLPAERYLEALPRVAADPEQAMVLVYGEVLSRTAAGERPTLDEYRRRFPQLADHLTIQFQLHAALHPTGTDLTAVPAEPLTASATVAHAEPPHTAGGPPAAVGPYRILGELGRGGMGVVYAAHDPTLDREVAVKTFPPDRFAPPQAVARFQREARVSARLQHPAVPPVYAVGELTDGTPYLAMKLVRGRTLADQLKDRPDSADDLPRFLGVFEQVCQAVGYAHAHGVIHRDLKPANVMVGEFGEVQVMDWGLARAFSIADFRMPIDPPGAPPHPTAGEQNPQSAIDDPQFTAAGAILGTPAYIAPEQARGEAIDPRADVFALGGLLCVLLTGRPPFVAPDTAQTVLKARQADTAEALERLRAGGADPELTDIAARCLSGSVVDRPADGRAVAELVAAYRAGVAARLRRSETEQAAAAREVEGRRKRRWRRAAAGAGAVLLTAAGLFAWGYDRQAADLAKANGENRVK